MATVLEGNVRAVAASGRESGWFLRALTRDFCPGWNHRVRWLRHPLVVLGAAALAALLLGFGVSPRGFVVCGGICVVMALGMAWPWLAMRGITASLRFERTRAREGEPVEAILTVHNRWPFPVWGIALEHGFRQASGALQATWCDVERDAGVELALARVAALSKSQFRWIFLPTARGYYPVAKPHLTTTFPFGLYRAEREVEVDARLLVWPRVVPLSLWSLRSTVPSATGAWTDAFAAHDGDVIGVRPFRQGDSLRHVHWTQTARHGRLIVRERQAHTLSRVRVTLDVDPRHHASLAGESSLEWCIRIVASVVQSMQNQGASVECVVQGRVLASSMSPHGWRGVLDELANLPPKFDAASWPSPVGPPAGGATRHVLVTTDIGWADQATTLPGRQVILLNTKAWERNDRFAEGGETFPGAWIVIDDVLDPGLQFRRRWERNCHVA